MRSFFIIFCCFLAFSSSAQSLPDSCKLAIGTNLGGISDYGTEIPFVDVMHNCRTWYTKDLGNPNGSPFDSGNASKLSYRSDGYPTQVPQTISGVSYPQKWLRSGLLPAAGLPELTPYYMMEQARLVFGVDSATSSKLRPIA